MRDFGILDWVKRQLRSETLAPLNLLVLTQWLEVLLIPAIAIALGWLANPQDPLLTDAQFPWLWLAPVLIALRYGVLSGLLACVPLILNWFIAERLDLITEHFTLAYFFGGGMLVLLCGEFSDIWRDRNEHMDETNVYLAERLSRLTKRHLLLNLSHDRLEQEMLARPSSLRDALVRLRNMTIDHDHEAAPLQGAAEMLQLLSQYVGIESATLYTLKTHTHAHADTYELGAEVQRVGEPEVLKPGDELLKLALEQHQLAHIASQELSQNRSTNQLVVAPLVAGDHELIGVLAVTHMPFFSLNVENLQMMSVILSYYADTLWTAPEVALIQQRIAGIPAQFAEELARMQQMQKKTGITSQIIIMKFKGTLKNVIPVEFLRIKRGIDLYWQSEAHGLPMFAVLMPFASSAAVQGFTQRVEGWLANRFDGDFESLGVQLQIIDFSVEDPLNALALAMQEKT
jgi:hypothetical protein